MQASPPVLAFHHLVDQADHLTGLDMPLGLQLREKKPAVNGNLKASAIRGDQGDRLDHMLELLQKLTCQAHGPVGVVSDCAVDDLDLQHEPSQ